MTRSSFLLAADPAMDLAVATAFARELQNYIVDDDLYRTVFVHTPTGDQSLQMTGGDLLARLYRLQQDRESLSPQQQAQLDEVQQSVRNTIYSLRTRFYERLQRETKTRLNSLKWFLDDCNADRQRCRVEYPFEIRNRQRIEEILKELEGKLDEDVAEQLHRVDQRLHATATRTGFVWDERLQPLFPRRPYWYLYVSP
jgi:hypothetical protein